LSKILTVAIRLEEAESNPCQNVERFALDNQRVRYLTEEEENRLFKALGDDQLLRTAGIIGVGYYLVFFFQTSFLWTTA